MEITSILKKLQIAELNSMQNSVLDQFKPNQDFVLLSPTGSGKTLAFSLLVSKLIQSDKNLKTQALIVVPTRELALQIESFIKKVITGYKILCVYGGHDTKTERNALKEAPTIIIGTPGRIIYHLERNYISTADVHTFVLDEFDKSLELGFQDQLQEIMQAHPNIKQKILTSATDLDVLPDFVALDNAIKVDNLDSQENKPSIIYKKVISPVQYKLRTLFNLLCTLGEQKILIFCNHREAVDHISELLDDRDLIHDVFHGGLEQRDRELSILKFRNNSNRILLTTDLAARGLDIPEIDVIIHYQLPGKEDAFIHRNGRTARMHAKGEVIVMLKPDDNFPYLPESTEEIKVEEDLYLPNNTPYSTLYISAGKKDKVNKIDIVGYILKLDGLEKDDIGVIEVKDKEAYIAVKRKVATQIIKEGSNGKIKGNKIKFIRT
ncbi:DEAD/DEAH box helicase [Sphingobacterium bovistauri]|uniref:DEAD/DEAH box helicase n=1 Tax=Sphingobacterium bovistauri TaxID=2781959 RepID=A0ABS7Z4R7_9SPHI|nr:DEAD/DEAH box helicase [Sphingobacterium bovistauri]MCA5003749.1 DEAD/DEAH box helicase [Sphingobacterium bovistauri]